MVSGILRALKDAQISVVVYGISCWGVGFPLAYFLSRQGWGPIGIWWGMCTGFATSCLMLQIYLELRIRMLINLKPAKV